MAKKTLLSVKSEYSSYKVVDRIYNYRPARVLYGEGRSPQSGVALDDEPELLFHYNQRFLEIAQSLHPTSILVIGGGAFTLPTVLFHYFQEAVIDVVEIDPILKTIAYEYFNLPKDERLSVFDMDGREYIKTTDKKYDLIILDAFSGYEIPRKLLTVEAAALYKRHLSDGGLLTINFISQFYSYKKYLTHELLQTFESVFEYVELYQADHETDKRIEQNLLLTVSDSMLSLDYLQSETVQTRFRPDDVILRDANV